jgi:ectoine hydroxylase-related dioxygenase (phytanoyl-CoA dioxygenase family)
MLKANLPWIESPFFSQILQTKKLSAEQNAMAEFYHNNGYLRLSNILPENLIDQVKADAENKGFNKNFPIQTMRNEERVQDLWQYSEPVSALASFQPILDILELFYGREAIPFQTLNFCVGSQQRAHSDSIHFSSLPGRYMCGVWVALEDVTLESGPLFYYPGSHKMPEYNFSHIKETADPTTYENYKEYEDFMEALLPVTGFKKEIFLAKKGDVLIWSSNIIHGGMPVLTSGLSRWSQVTHYFFKDCYYYTPMLSNMVTDELFLRNHLINIKTKERITPSYNGQPIKYLRTSTNKYIVHHQLSLLQVLKTYGKNYVKKILKKA